MADMFNPYEQQIVGLKEQKALAQKLREQAMEPLQGQMVGGWYVAPSWTQALAKGVNAYLGTKREKAAEQGIKDVMAKREQDITGIMGELPQERVIRPENRPEDNVGPVLPAVTKQPTARDYMSWGLRASQIDPSLGQYGNTMANMVQHEQAQQESRDARREDLQMRLEDARAGRQEKIDAQRELERMRQEDRKAEAERNRQSREDMVRLAASLRPGPQPQAPVAVIDPQTNQPVYVPPSQAYGKQPAKGAEEKPLTEFQGKSVMFGTRAAQSHNILNDLEDKVKPTAVAINQAGGVLTNWAMAPEVQKVTQAQRDFVNAVLRQESGASISGSEFENARKQYFPQPGDSPEVIAQKRANRETAIKGFARQAGPSGQRDIMDVWNAQLAAPAAGGTRRDTVTNPMNPPAQTGGRNVRVDF